jgi:hypothetical protein
VTIAQQCRRSLTRYRDKECANTSASDSDADCERESENDRLHAILRSCVHAFMHAVDTAIATCTVQALPMQRIGETSESIVHCFGIHVVPAERRSATAARMRTRGVDAPIAVPE